VSESTTRLLRVPNPALAAQMAQHEGLVRWVVRQQWRGALSFADALQAGRIGLWRALQSYDPTRGNRFSSYAVPAIAHALWAEVGAASTEPRPLCPDPADFVEESDLAQGLHQAQVTQTLHALVATLPARLHDVIVWHYGLDGALPQTFTQIGDEWGISRQRVHQLHVQALLLLAHPAHSHALRLLTDHQQRGAYQRSLARQHQRTRANRRHAP
jgi:RNA polymerase sigma factor (sigma-70 family)